jgi:hypothetical protein
MFGLEEELKDKIEKLEKTVSLQEEMINLLEGQVVDLTMMSKIELGDDVIAEIRRIKESIKQNAK